MGETREKTSSGGGGGVHRVRRSYGVKKSLDRVAAGGMTKRIFHRKICTLFVRVRPRAQKGENGRAKGAGGNKPRKVPGVNGKWQDVGKPLRASRGGKVGLAKKDDEGGGEGS